MMNEQERKWKALERLLPVIKDSVEKYKRMQRLHEQLNRRMTLVKKQIQSLKAIEQNEIIYEVDKVRAEIAEIEEKELKELDELYEEYKELSVRMDLDYLYYPLFEDLRGIRIRKGQVSPSEFEALLYYAMRAGIPRKSLFANFYEMYPYITKAWDEEKERRILEFLKRHHAFKNEKSDNAL